MIARRQLLELGFSAEAIRHRVERKRLFPIFRGIYSVGRPKPSIKGLWTAAVLACGEGAALSHESAAALAGIRKPRPGPIHVSIPGNRSVRIKGIKAHRREQMPPTTTIDSILVSQPLFTLIDLAATLPDRALEAAVNEADKLRLIDPKEAQGTLGHLRAPGINRLRRIFGLHKRTDSDLERDFLRLIRKHGLPEPITQQRFDCGRVDFYWPDHKLVVETDGSAYHRTPTQQLNDRRREQAHMRAELQPLRFTDIQIDHHPDEVIETLQALLAQQR